MAETKKSWTSYRLSQSFLDKYKKAFTRQPANFGPMTDLGNDIMEYGREKAERDAAAKSEQQAELDKQKQANDKAMSKIQQDADAERGPTTAERIQGNITGRFQESLDQVEYEADIKNKLLEKQKKKDDTARIKQGLEESGKLPSPMKMRSSFKNTDTQLKDYDSELKDASGIMSSRGSAATRQIQKEFENILRYEKENKFFSGEEGKADSIATLGKLGAGVKSDISTGGVIETAHEIYKESGFSKGMSDREKEVWTKIWRGENVTPGYTEYDNLFYRVPMDDGTEALVDNAWMNESAVNNTYPHKREQEFMEALIQVEDQGRAGGSWNKEAMIAQSKAMIKPENIMSIALDPTFGSTKSLLENSIQAGIIPDVDVDWRSFINEAKNNPEQYEELATMLAQGIESTLRGRYNIGHNKHKEENGGTDTSGMSVADKIEYYRNLA